MSVYWGVDSSYYPANKVIKVHGKKCTVWEYICQEATVLRPPPLERPHLGPSLSLEPDPWPEAHITPSMPLMRLTLPGEKQPDFWGRYLGRHEITGSEAQYIFDHSGGNCRILLVYNLTSQAVVGGTRQDGLRAARDASHRAAKLGVRAGTSIYCDVEGVWYPTADFFQGWWEGMEWSLYQPGIYGRTDAPNFTRPLLRAMRVDNPSLVPKSVFGTRYIWTTRPQIGKRKRPGDFSVFAPIEPRDSQGTYHGGTVVHQYALDKNNGMIDYDLANQDGYDSMWKSSS